MRYLIPILLAIACSSCSTAPKSIPAAAQPPLQHGPIISRIMSRHAVIVIRAGASEPTYSLESASGELLVRDSTLGELASNNPDMFREIQTMRANASTSLLSTDP